ncbi:DUF4817 domain-containing protein [Trichonephila clavipes]|nr:DUF4817 domain-containing protein [Trichonephila clavipes]
MHVKFVQVLPPVGIRHRLPSGQVEDNGRCTIFSQEQRIAIVEFYFATKSHSRVMNAFQQKYPGEAALNASTITLLVQRIRGTGSVADRKRSGRASLVETKVADVETALQRSPMK